MSEKMTLGNFTSLLLLTPFTVKSNLKTVSNNQIYQSLFKSYHRSAQQEQGDSMQNSVELKKESDTKQIQNRKERQNVKSSNLFINITKLNILVQIVTLIILASVSYSYKSAIQSFVLE